MQNSNIGLLSNVSTLEFEFRVLKMHTVVHVVTPTAEVQWWFATTVSCFDAASP